MIDDRFFLWIIYVLISALFLFGCVHNIDYHAKTENDEALPLVPEYYNYDSYLDNKVQYINDILSSEGVISAFVFITDPHWEFNSRQSPALLRYLQFYSKINRLFCGGDLADGCNEWSYNFINSLQESWQGEFYCAVGNHEYLGANANEEAVYELFNTNSLIQTGNPKRHYFYLDDIDSHVRYIILSSFSESRDGGSHAGLGYEKEQCEWLKNKALNVLVGWKIIIITHFLYWIELNSDIIIQPRELEEVTNIIDNYNGPGKIIAIFQGHNHRDRIIHTLKNNIPVVVTTCDKNIILDEQDQLNVIRPRGTISEQAFDVIVINELDRIIHCVRIGCPAKDGEGNTIGNDVEERIVKF